MIARIRTIRTTKSIRKGSAKKKKWVPSGAHLFLPSYWPRSAKLREPAASRLVIRSGAERPQWAIQLYTGKRRLHLACLRVVANQYNRLGTIRVTYGQGFGNLSVLQRYKDDVVFASHSSHCTVHRLRRYRLHFCSTRQS